MYLILYEHKGETLQEQDSHMVLHNMQNGHLKYVLDIRLFIFNKLPENGTLVPKHVAVGT
jgi:hypothetical protein